MQFKHLGTVSHGTLRNEDLIPAFVDALSDVLEWWTMDLRGGDELETTR